MFLFYLKYGRIILSSIGIFLMDIFFIELSPIKVKLAELKCTLKNRYSIVFGKIYNWVPTLGDVKFENLWIELIKDKTKYIVGGIYRHPNHDFGVLRDLLETSLRKISKSNKPCFVVGDINIDFMKFHQHSGIRD